MSELPLLVFTCLTGLSAGSYFIATVFGLVQKRTYRTLAFDVVCLVALGVGLLGVLFHLGHPERFLNAFANPTSMITQEAYWSIPLGILMIIDAALLWRKKKSGNVLPMIISIVCLGLMCVTTIEYLTSYGIAGWAEWPTFFLFLFADIAMGAAFVSAFLKIEIDRTVALVCMVLYVVLCVGFIAEAVVFSGLAVGAVPFIVSFVLTLVATVMGIDPLRGKKLDMTKRWILFALVFVSIVVARYAFYAMV